MSLIRKKGFGLLLAIFTLAFSFSTNLSAEEVRKINPYDFYQGTELDISDSSSPFFWLQLPENAYINSAYPQTLQDIRVFNGTGDEVPSALFYDADKLVSTFNISFITQRLISQLDNVNSKDEERQDKQYLLVETIPSKVSRIELPNRQTEQKSIYQAYLLTRSETQQDKNLAIQSLNLDWVKNEQDWQAKVFIYASYDKKEWVNIV